MSRTPLLSLANVKKNFANVTALEDVSFDLYPGEILALLGENGAGKSTLVNVISGVLQQDGGEIAVDGRQVKIGNPEDAYRLGIAVIHQELNLAQELSVAENIFLGSKPTRRVLGILSVVDYREMNRQAQNLLNMFDCGVSPKDLISDLSPTERQLMEILKGMRRQCRVFLMDEPTAGLDDAEVSSLFSFIRQLKSSGVAIIYVSHILEEVERIADRILVLRDGHKVNLVDAKTVKMDEIIAMMVGHQVNTSESGRPPRSTGEVVLRLDGITTSDGYVNDASLALHEGEILGLAGLTTSGRSELLRAIYGLDRLRRGRIYVDGIPRPLRYAKDAAKLGLGMIPRDRKGDGIFGIRSVKENTTISSLRRFSGALGITSNAEELRLAEEIEGKLRVVYPTLSSSISSLSGGNQQKVIFGRWLAAKPRILLCDEPTRGVDVGAKAEIAEIIRDFAEQGISTMISSSELPELVALCDRILVMFKGKIVKEFRSDTVRKDDLMRWIETGHDNEPETE